MGRRRHTVIRKDEHWLGVPAVIDKDHLSACGTELDANALIISTGVDAVKLNLEEIMKKFFANGIERCRETSPKWRIPVGSMGPKVAALIDAVQVKPNLQAIICQPGDALASIRGSSGTTVFNERAIRGSNPHLRIKSPSLYLTKLMAHWWRGTPSIYSAAKPTLLF